MSDYYTEQLVKKKPDMKDMMTKAILIAVTIVSILAVLYYPIIILVPVLLIGLDIFMFHRLKVEYEYLYVNGDLDIDKIMNKSKRKRVFSATSIHVCSRKVHLPPRRFKNLSR